MSRYTCTICDRFVAKTAKVCPGCGNDFSITPQIDTSISFEEQLIRDAQKSNEWKRKRQESASSEFDSFGGILSSAGKAVSLPIMPGIIFMTMIFGMLSYAKVIPNYVTPDMYPKMAGTAFAFWLLFFIRLRIKGPD